MKVFIVTDDGAPSCVFLSEDTAEKAVDLGYGDDFMTFELDEYAAQVESGNRRFYLKMRRDGRCKHLHQETSGSPFNGDPLVLRQNWRIGSAGMEYYGPFFLVGYLFAPFIDDAVKIANEKRIQLITSGEWPEE